MADESSADSLTNRVLRLTEDVVYILICFVLVGGALVLLVKAAYELITGSTGDVKATVSNVLDTLLLVFILIELLSAVRTTLIERQLLAEPFLLVGIIATIKEIVIGSLDAKALAGKDPGAFDDVMTEIAVLGGVLLVLAVSSFLLRRKEREPDETEGEEAEAERL